MAHEQPTPTELIERFPEFEGADNDYVQLLIEEAARSVDDTWFQADHKLAILFLAAHLLKVMVDAGAVETTMTSTSTSVSLEEGLYVRQISFGNRSVSFGSKRGGMFGETVTRSGKEIEVPFADSIYGQLFLRLLRRNSAHVLVV